MRVNLQTVDTLYSCVCDPVISDDHWSLHVAPEVCPVPDLGGDVPQLGGAHRVVHGQVLLGHVRQPLEIDVDIRSVPVNTRNLNVAFEISAREENRFISIYTLQEC